MDVFELSQTSPPLPAGVASITGIEVGTIPSPAIYITIYPMQERYFYNVTDWYKPRTKKVVYIISNSKRSELFIMLNTLTERVYSV